jgi:hypothetical protein
MSAKKTEPFNFRVSTDMLKRAKEKGINLPEAMRELIRQIADSDECPCCGHIVTPVTTHRRKDK